MSVDSTTATSVSLSWSIPSASEVDSFVVMWQLLGSEVISTATFSGSTTSYTVEGLESGSLYNISVTAENDVGSVTSSPVRVSTHVAGN